MSNAGSRLLKSCYRGNSEEIVDRCTDGHQDLQQIFKTDFDNIKPSKFCVRPFTILIAFLGKFLVLMPVMASVVLSATYALIWQWAAMSLMLAFAWIRVKPLIGCMALLSAIGAVVCAAYVKGSGNIAE